MSHARDELVVAVMEGLTQADASCGGGDFCDGGDCCGMALADFTQGVVAVLVARFGEPEIEAVNSLVHPADPPDDLVRRLVFPWQAVV